MDKKLQELLKKYITDVEGVCVELLDSINASENLNLKTKFDFFEYRSKCKKNEFQAGATLYKLHGIGCIALNDKMYLDWDFGYRSRWCGIDPWKFSRSLKENDYGCSDYYDGNKVQAFCNLLIEQDIMFKKCDLYYFKIPENEMFKPKFPVKYDTLVIETSNLEWHIPRNKLIERFIRKSTRVYNQIKYNGNNYMLRFLLDDREIYSIPYDDVGYPENAVKIMSDEIIQNLLKQTNTNISKS